GGLRGLCVERDLFTTSSGGRPATEALTTVRLTASAEGYGGPPKLQRRRKLYAEAEAGHYDCRAETMTPCRARRFWPKTMAASTGDRVNRFPSMVKSRSQLRVSAGRK